MNETIKTIQSLRTIHGNFSNRKISDEDLEIIVNSSVRAANASNRQSYSIIVISDKQKIKKLSEYHGEKMLVFCVDFARLVDLAEHLGYQFEINDMSGFVTGSTDAVLAAQTACIAAKSLGIDSLFTQRRLHRCDIEKVFKELQLPNQYCFPIVALLLGYPSEEPAYQKGRLHGNGVIHDDVYHRLTDQEKDALIAEYDNKERHLSLIDHWDKQEGIKHYLDWFYNKWSWRFDTRQFVSILKKAKFLLF